MTYLTVGELADHLRIDLAEDDLREHKVLSDKLAAAEQWISSMTGVPIDASTPAPLLEAVRQLAGHLYENREATLVGVSAQALPFGVYDAVLSYREWSF